MSCFVHLTQDRPVYFRADWIVSVEHAPYTSRFKTVIGLSDGRRVEIHETPDRVLASIVEANQENGHD